MDKALISTCFRYTGGKLMRVFQQRRNFIRSVSCAHVDGNFTITLQLGNNDASQRLDVDLRFADMRWSCT